MYNFALNMYRMGRMTADEVRAFVAKGYITEAQAETILSEAIDDN